MEFKSFSPKRFRTTLHATVLSLGFGLASLSFAAPLLLEANTESEKYQKTLDYIFQMGQDIYCYWDLKRITHQVDWDAIISHAKNQVNEQTTPEQFQEILTRVAASVHDGHVNYIYSTKNKLFYIPIDVKKIGNQYFVSKVEKDKMWPNNIDIEPGDHVMEVNGQNIVDYIEEKSQLISASTSESKKSYAASSINSLEKFKKAPENNVVLKIQKFKSWQIKEVELPWQVYDRAGRAEKSLSDIVKSSILPGNIGLLTLTQMYHASGKEAHIAYIKGEMEALKHTNALIIDVRDNGGGLGEIGDSVIAHFITENVNRYKAKLKNSIQAIYARPDLLQTFTQTDPVSYEFSEWADYVINPLNQDAPLYDKPVFVLTNENCFSACDTFVDSFSSNHLGEVLGAQTGGGTGYPLWIDLPWDLGNFRFSILIGYSNHDRYLEGVGTIPDLEIQALPDELHAQIDGELKKAYEYVLHKLQIKPKKLQSLASMSMFKQQNNEVIPYAVKEEEWQQLQSQ